MAFLVVGLGNPGPQYEKNRHNIGFMVVDRLAGFGAGFREKFHGQFLKMSFGLDDLILLKPQTYMNKSGQSVGRAASFFKVEPPQVIVIHDELDLPLGAVRIKAGGGHAGHNGLRSIFNHFPKDFIRIRCGIGRPTFGDVSNYVLGDFPATDAPLVDDMIVLAEDAVLTVVREGVLAAQNRIHPQGR